MEAAEGLAAGWRDEFPDTHRVLLLKSEIALNLRLAYQPISDVVYGLCQHYYYLLIVPKMERILPFTPFPCLNHTSGYA